MGIHLKNVTENIININDVGVIIPPNEIFEIVTNEKKYEIGQSNDLVKLISNEEIVVNDDIQDLSPADGIRHLSTDAILTGPKDRSGKIRVHQTSRKLGTMTCFTGAGDDPNEMKNVGTGQECIYDHKIGDPIPSTMYIDLNIIENETWVHEGYLTWEDGKFDQIDVMVVPRVTNIAPGENTFYSLYNNYLIIPAAGDGTWDLTSDITQPHGGLVHMPLSDLGVRGASFWNADFNSETMLFENLTAAPLGNGEYNMFAAEVPFFKLFNKVPMLGNGFVELRTSDTSELGHGMRFKILYKTRGDDHDWRVAFSFVFHRKYTIMIP